MTNNDKVRELIENLNSGNRNVQYNASMQAARLIEKLMEPSNTMVLEGVCALRGKTVKSTDCVRQIHNAMATQAIKEVLGDE